VAGFEDEPVAFGSAVNVKLAKILTRECDMVLNLPILKDHEMSGITFSMKNMYGVVHRIRRINCMPPVAIPGVADLNCIPVDSREGALHHW
jgi:uncharacterized protein (DUF362 family)